jgi:2-polyprenyl-3-methyl-5-hydroxy-6-metoxy-1,4-benzoquinol methylase
MNDSIQQLVGNTDIYLLDQIIKGRYDAGSRILDAGCGMGRNLHWYLQNDYTVYGIDTDENSIAILKKENPSMPSGNFNVMPVENMTFDNEAFDHVICSAVLHFANNTGHFFAMMTEVLRILKPGGSLFIRMTSNIGIESLVQLISDGVYKIPDGTTRFLLTKTLLNEIMHQYNLNFLEPLKTVNVNDKRCMSTLVIHKS